MAACDLVEALIITWIDELTSSDPKIKSEATGMLQMARLSPPPLIAYAAARTGLEPGAILDQIEARAAKSKVNQGKTNKNLVAARGAK